MIDLNKQYQTECGFPVLLLAIIEGNSTYPVIGLYCDEGDWAHTSWTIDGRINVNALYSDLNLEEVGNSTPVLPAGIRVPKFGPEMGAELATASEASLQAWDRFLVPPAATA
jgi:hypothetical protein